MNGGSIPDGRRQHAGQLTPPDLPFTPAERRIVDTLRTPAAVQGWLNRLPYNTERGGGTQRTFRGVVRHGMAHCMEAAISAAVILEQRGYPPLVMSLESIDLLDHVLFVYRHSGRWGSVARSRDPGLHGRRPVFRTARALALSYVDTYVDYSGGIKGYGVADLRDLGSYDWRFSVRSVWRAERFLLDYPHRRIRPSRVRTRALRRRYREFRAAHDDLKPVDYEGMDRWTPIPDEFMAAARFPFAGPLWRARRFL